MTIENLQEFMKKAYPKKEHVICPGIFTEYGWLKEGTVAYGIVVSESSIQGLSYGFYVARLFQHTTKRGSPTFKVKPVLAGNALFRRREGLDEYIKKEKARYGRYAI